MLRSIRYIHHSSNFTGLYPSAGKLSERWDSVLLTRQGLTRLPCSIRYHASMPGAHPLVPKQHLNAPLPDDCQILELRDGRLMSFAEYGSKQPGAHAFIFCHGIPDCRLDACLLPSDRRLAERFNIRWIGIDRPGIGLSTFHKGRTICSWVHDLQQLLDHLKLDRYYIFSVSGGTGYALAAAMMLPRKNIRGVGIMVGVAPWDAGTQGMSVVNRVAYQVWKYYPGLFRMFYAKYMIPPMQQESSVEAENIVRTHVRYSNADEREIMEQPGAIGAFAGIWREVCRQGPDGCVEDSKIQTSPWGFAVEDVNYPGIRLWYGTKDVNTPPAMGRYLAARMPNSIYKEYEGKTHFTVWHHMEEIVTDLLQDD